MPPLTIDQVIAQYLESVHYARSEATARTYKTALKLFRQVLEEHRLSLNEPMTALNEDTILWLIAELKSSAPTTERLYLTAVMGFFEFVAASEYAPINLPRVRLLVKQRARRPGLRLPQFPWEAIESVLAYAERMAHNPFEDDSARLRTLRDRAFLISLADTGLRVHEACGLRRGDVDWNSGQAVIIGKGDKQAVVRFSRRAQSALRDYLKARAVLDGASRKPLSALPLFARHDPGAGKKILPITPTTGRNIVSERVAEALGGDFAGNITPHSFRHYFVTRILRASNNLKLAQSLARHSNIAVTQRYAHLSDNELDEGYWKVFEEGDQT